MNYRNERIVQIAMGETVLCEGNPYVPNDVKGLVLFAHGSGISRFSHAIVRWLPCCNRRSWVRCCSIS